MSRGDPTSHLSGRAWSVAGGQGFKSQGSRVTRVSLYATIVQESQTGPGAARSDVGEAVVPGAVVAAVGRLEAPGAAADVVVEAAAPEPPVGGGCQICTIIAWH